MRDLLWRVWHWHDLRLAGWLNIGRAVMLAGIVFYLATQIDANHNAIVKSCQILDRQIAQSIPKSVPGKPSPSELLIGAIMDTARASLGVPYHTRLLKQLEAANRRYPPLKRLNCEREAG